MTADQHGLVAQLARIHALLESPSTVDDVGAVPPALSRLVDIFGLTPFERDVVLLCAGLDLDSRFAARYAAAHGDPRRTAPTFGLALANLPEAHWDAQSPARPLRFWRLVELGPGTGLVDRELRLDERILQYITGVPCLDQRLDGLIRPSVGTTPLTASQLVIADEVANLLTTLPDPARVGVEGADTPTREQVARTVAGAVGRMLLTVAATDLPAGTDATTLARLVERESALLGAIVFVSCGPDVDADRISGFVNRLGCPVLIGGDRLPAALVPTRREVALPTEAEGEALWKAALDERGVPYDDAVRELAGAFRFGADTIEVLATEVRAYGSGASESALRHVCRVRARAGLDELATRIDPVARWSDLVLPAGQVDLLRDLARHLRHRGLVYRDWAMGGATARGLGITALFAGESGTGKTLAAEVVARELDLDLYRVDLSAVVSKYIGETEKNLRRVFDAADASGAVLLFDEADALFGKRSEVKDSHDRYANLEISYLLQCMEAYRGLAILTTNLRDALDRAFLRRIRFVVTFPFPDPAAREQIWRLMFPPALPTDELDVTRLGRLQVPGGSIRNIALSAAFLAADDHGRLTMEHLLEAARREYAKLDRPLTATETGGWR